MKLEIYTGREFSCDFTIVSDDGITPEILDPTDTGTFTLSTQGTKPTILLSNIPLTLVNMDNGSFNLLLTAEQTCDLEFKVGFEEDRYPTLSTHVGLLDFTLVSGNRQATVDIFVKGINSCPQT
jgi:hypothetical protein